MIKKSTKVVLGTVVTFCTGLLLSFPTISQAKEVDITPEITISNYQEEVVVGSTGKYSYKINDIQGEAVTGEVFFSSEDAEIFTIDKLGNWQGKKAGETIFTYYVKLSEASLKKLAEKFPDDTLITKEVAKGFSVQVIEDKKIPIYRLYNKNSGEHLYTPIESERDNLKKLGWKSEGVAWYAPQASKNAAVARLYNPNAGDHFYTSDSSEINYLVSVGWSKDALSFATAGKEDSAVYRLYNPNAHAGAHHYTLSTTERDQLIAVGWKDEGTAFNAYIK
ncbi:hypothetical protein M2139_000221 [Enterococcus sp. PF1-24]|uniref:hypothetical protein n=1 Tax=unclassified Enterococcus TaxID=2608891 RepID=UPI0024758B6B|nr:MULTISPECIES: hypothetical protein [unclassified Enterococcus]MDH6363359.1 hypothetical protein [Enterococcus sp. PFB1-1]MDH6400340.1 hypothetical protein [Enterococcus sp. PF1-24]